MEQSGKGRDGENPKGGQGVALERQREDAASPTGHRNGRQEEEEEEDEEMTPERLQSLLDDIKQEGGSEDEEMTEERMKEILHQLHQAEKPLCSVPGWRCETSGGIAESAATGTEEGR